MRKVGLRGPGPILRNGRSWILLASGGIYGRRGRVLFGNNQVDVKTGTIRVVGEFANPRACWFPACLQVRALIGVETNALVVPQRAVADVRGVP